MKRTVRPEPSQRRLHFDYRKVPIRPPELLFRRHCSSGATVPVTSGELRFPCRRLIPRILGWFSHTPSSCGVIRSHEAANSDLLLDLVLIWLDLCFLYICCSRFCRGSFWSGLDK